MSKPCVKQQRHTSLPRRSDPQVIIVNPPYQPQTHVYSEEIQKLRLKVMLLALVAAILALLAMYPELLKFVWEIIKKSFAA
jgi:hypothetical protein